MCVVLGRLRYKGTEGERKRDVRDRETVMSTPVETDKRDRGRVGLHNESSSMEVACGRNGERGSGGEQENGGE